jgi:hypothetical protein
MKNSALLIHNLSDTMLLRKFPTMTWSFPVSSFLCRGEEIKEETQERSCAALPS